MDNALTLSDVFFKLAIFSLLLYKGIGWLRDYLKPWLITSKQHDHNEITKLVEKDTLLTTSTNKLSTQIHQQAQLFAILEHKIKRWHEALAAEKTRIETEQQDIVVNHQKLIATQQQALKVRLSILAIAPQAFDRATASFLSTEANSRNIDFLNSLISEMKGRSQ
jgi:hypothetical protein